MTLKVGQRVRVINSGPYAGQVGTITSWNGDSIYGVELEGRVTLPVYGFEIEPVRAQTPHDFFRRAG
jgi:hypothetical protein